MKIKEVKKFADLTRIKITEQEAQKYSEDFSGIMKMLDHINEVEISEEIVRDFKLKNTMREDKIDFDKKVRDKVVREFSEKNNDYLKVQKILNN